MFKLSAQFRKMLQAIGVTTAYVFGSRAQGNSGPLSDYDIAVLLDEKINPRQYFDLKLRLAGEFSAFLKTDKIDLVILNNAPSILVMNVISHGKILFDQNKKYRIAFETYAMARYFDRLPYEERYIQYMTEKYA